MVVGGCACVCMCLETGRVYRERWKVCTEKEEGMCSEIDRECEEIERGSVHREREKVR